MSGDAARSPSGRDGPAIEAKGLVKTFGETRALDGLDLTVPAGGVYGVLGPNGAGKTTALRILSTLLRPDGGTARVLGHDVLADADGVRRRISLTGQFASVDEELTGRENLILLGRLLGFRHADAAARARRLLTAIDLADAADRQAKTYSGGMRRRLDIAAGIVVTPDLMFLDEPTTGLDPRSRNQVWTIVRALVARGTTVVLTTQYLDEADQLADRIAVIDHGRVIAEGTPGELKASVGSGILRVRVQDPAQRFEAVRVLTRALDADVQVESDPSALTVRVDDSERSVQALAELNRSGIATAQFALGQPTLDEVFLALTGHSVKEVAA
ncbi:ATP-binding cassette domain-containing protein [Actinoplanes sp. NBRC 103695]|uniref:ATP-binding cassette domain-containing protein n=1 Tax=Actinoplanes sp. NBRC 103695 TaxID=3032202 RepID=UPI0024A49A7B|nr:ATP-binding cassette domain-containing protein [Actinoplanes sp. NBRC 103695]GLZ00703.1 daunorubicin resistance protein DrrA family ABC transporter ATP-binding protein [Actinoplanes sp. NBRC 103695]